MRALLGFILFCCIGGKAQTYVPVDSLWVEHIDEVYYDDYQNVYLYEQADFSLTKLNAKGEEQGRLMLVYPFKIQPIQNPLNVFLFSEAAQELRIVDQNLNEIQRFRVPSDLGYIKAVAVQNLRTAWLLNITDKTLIYYDYREGKVLNSIVLPIDVADVQEFMVMGSVLYCLTADRLVQYDMQTGDKTTIAIAGAKKIKREGQRLFILTNTAVYELVNGVLQPKFNPPKARIVEKNYSGYLAVIGNKVYLYTSF